MKTVIALAASLVVNLAAFGALDLSVRQAQVAPTGEVSVRQLVDPSELPAYAQLAQAAAGSASTL